MSDTHGFRRRIKVGFAVVVILAAAIALTSLFALRSVIVAKDQVISEYAHDLLFTRELELASEQNASSSRAFLLTGDARYLEKVRRARDRFKSCLDQLRSTTPLPEEARLLEAVAGAAAAHQAALDQAISAQSLKAGARQIAELFEATVSPRRERLQESLAAFVREKERLLKEAVTRSRAGAADAMLLVATLGTSAAVLASILFFLSTRTLARLGRAEAEIRNLNENLEKRVLERTREIEGFAYTVAHDLRAPLRTMAGFSDILLEESGPRLDDSGRDHLRRIQGAARRMDDLIQGILSLARISYQSFTLAPVDLSGILRGVVASKKTEIQATSARVELETPPAVALGHPFLLTLSLDHLLSNALKFVAPGVNPRIRVKAHVQGETVRLSVSDNGIGIAPQHAGRIFGVFERLQPAEEFPGVGIGLAIVRRAVERMGGAVGVMPNPEGGATFWIELRTAAAAEAPAHLLPTRPPGLSGAH